MGFHVPEDGRVTRGQMASNASAGNNGCFRFYAAGKPVLAQASDGGGWEHVSISLPDHRNLLPSWTLMCKIKEMFWDAEDCVVQFHPPKSQYVNRHRGCLHLWRSTQVWQPTPPTIYVG